MARLFNGSTDQINTAVSLPQANAMTMAGWAYASSLPHPYQIAFSLVNAGAGFYFLIYIKSSGGLATYCQSNASSAIADPWPSGTFPTGTWVHLALASTNTVNTIGYLNGVQQFSIAAGANGSPLPPMAMTLGYDATGSPNRQWNGMVDDVAYWTAQLTAGEIAALAQGEHPWKIRSSALASSLPLFGLSSPEPDMSGNGINGTLTGTAFAPGAPTAEFMPMRGTFIPTVAAPTVTASLVYPLTITGNITVKEHP